jgi:hypothetical protein
MGKNSLFIIISYFISRYTVIINITIKTGEKNGGDEFAD